MTDSYLPPCVQDDGPGPKLLENHYTYSVVWMPEDNEYVAKVAEFPSMSYLAADQVAALAGLVSLVSLAIIDMNENGEDIPAIQDPATVTEQWAVQYINHYKGDKVVTLGNYDANFDTTDIVRDLQRQGFKTTLLRREITRTYGPWIARS